MGNTVNVVIVDDDPADLQRTCDALVQLTNRTDQNFNIIMLSDPDQAVQSDAQWYIIDIVLGNTDGFEVARKIKEKAPETYVMFCTTHDDLVFESFNTDVFYFIRKEHLYDDMTSALRKFIRYESRKEKYFELHQKGASTAVQLNRIMYFESAGNEMFIHTNDGDEIKDRCSFPQLLKELPDDRFIQISRNFLVNCEYIVLIDEQTLFLKNGMHFKIVKERVSKVKRAYMNYLARR